LRLDTRTDDLLAEVAPARRAASVVAIVEVAAASETSLESSPLSNKESHFDESPSPGASSSPVDLPESPAES